MLDADKIKQMREALKSGVKVVSAPQLFPTPNDLAEKMADILDLRSFDQVLEPSAGTGNLINVCDKGDIVAIELNNQLCQTLQSSFENINVKQGDFLELTTKEIGMFDKIIMNPPFAKNQDIKHITHAISFLKDGGTLVAICGEGPFFRSDKLSKEFRELLDDNDAIIEKLPQGSFKSSGTMVNTRLITIYKEVNND